MSLACIDSDRTAAVRRRYGGHDAKPTTRSRKGRRWTPDEDTYLIEYGPISTVKQLCAGLGRTDFSVRSRLKALGIRPKLERER